MLRPPKRRSAGFDALLFDLDGVITKTAAVHARLGRRCSTSSCAGGPTSTASRSGPSSSRRTTCGYVDGRRRYDGVASFLGSRGIELPWATAADGPDETTVCGLGNRKDRYFLAAVEAQGVEVFDDAVALLDAARAAGSAYGRRVGQRELRRRSSARSA